METILLIVLFGLIGWGGVKIGEFLESVAWRLWLRDYMEKLVNNWIRRNFEGS